MTIAIVGAGICGLYLAWKLSEMGYDVTVFERKEKIGKEVCSGLFSERILEFIPESQKLIQNQIDFVLIHWVAAGRRPRRTLKVGFSKKFFVMNHSQLDNLVADSAQKSGAEIFLNHNVTKQGLVTFQKFERVIGCDGPNSVVRESLGLPKPAYRLAIQGFLPQENFSNFVETWPVNQGFIWRIPRGTETEYGIISDSKRAKRGARRRREGGGRVGVLFDNFLEKNNLHLERVNSSIIPQGLIIPKNPRITLCGDAAGLTKPWSGGGVVWGLTAAEILLKNFPDFLKYKKAVEKFFLPKIILSKIATKMVYFLGYKIPWLLPKNIKIESDFIKLI